MSTWDRLESMARSISLEGGLQARIADPLWMLSRQWQVSEFRGDDAAQPAAVRITGQNVMLTGLKGNTGGQHPLPAETPLEAVVEGTPAPDFGAAGLHAAVRSGRRLIRLLNAAGLGKAASALRANFPLRLPDRLVQLGKPSAGTAALFARYGFDSAALASASSELIGKALETALSPEDQSRAEGIIRDWASWFRGRDGQTGSLAWNAERLEYAFSLSTGAGPIKNPVKVELDAPEHNGAHLDWYTFDVRSTIFERQGPPERTQTSLPIPVRFKGMPAARWWQFEDGTVNFGDLEAGPADLARLLVAEFATVYRHDWFMVPVTVPVGSLTQITGLEVIDNFGKRSRIQSTAANDARRSGGRVWRLFELAGDEISPEHPAPWLLVAPTLASDVNGPVLERVLLARDEGANLAWAIEGQVEGLLGRAVERAEAWYAAAPGETRPAALPQSNGEGSRPALSYDDQAWRYRLETPAPAWWIPFVPERMKPNSPQVRLRRARMQAWELYTEPGQASQVGPQGLLLDPRRPCQLYEEEVPRSGVRIERRWQFGRWHDGSYHVWLQRRKLAGRGERSSGLRWDALLPSWSPEEG